MVRLRGISFDFAPNRSAKEVIEEYRKQEKKVIKKVVEEKIKEAPKGTPVAQIIPEVKKELKIPESTPKIETPKVAENQVIKPSNLPSPSDPPVAQEPLPEVTVSSDVGSFLEEEVEEILNEVSGPLAPPAGPTDFVDDRPEPEADEQAYYDARAEEERVRETLKDSGVDERKKFLGELGYEDEVVPGTKDLGLQNQTFDGMNTVIEGVFNTDLDEVQRRVEEKAQSKKQSDPMNQYAQGGQWYKVTGYPGLEAAYFIEYVLPGGNKIYYYATREDLDQLEGIGPGQEPQFVGTVPWDSFKQGRFSGGNVGDVIGTDEHYSTRVEREFMSPTGDLLLPEWANSDPAIKDLFYIGSAEGWSDDRFLREMSKKDSFKQRYPAFQEMLSLTGGDHPEALANIQEYEYEVRQLNNRYGEETDSVALTTAAIQKGYSIEDLKQTYDIFERAEKNASTLIAFQNVINAEGLGFDVTSPQGIVDFFKGSAPTEIYDLYEATSISEQASKLDLTDLSVDEALEIARNTPGQLTQQQVSGALQAAAQTVAKYREYIDLGSYGLDADQIINLSLGYREPGGMTEIELTTAISRIYKSDENLKNLASGLAGNKSFQKNRQIRSIG